MLNRIAKFLLAMTALAPLAVVVGVNKASNGAEFWTWFPWIAVTFGLVVLCLAIMAAVRKIGGRQPLRIQSIKNADQEVVAFLITYLLPLFSESKLSFTGETLTGVVVLFIILLAVVNSNSYHFNPLLGLIGYHFYEVTADNGMTYIVVSRRCLKKAKMELVVTEMTDYIHLDVGGKNG